MNKELSESSPNGVKGDSSVIEDTALRACINLQRLTSVRGSRGRVSEDNSLKHGWNHAITASCEHIAGLFCFLEFLEIRGKKKLLPQNHLS